MLKIDGVNYQNKQYSVKNNSNYLAYANNNQTDSVSFKSKLTMTPQKVSLFKKLGALIGIPSAIATVQNINKKQQEQELQELEEQGREYFESALNQPYGQSYWFNAFEEHPEILEKLLMEEDNVNGITQKRLYFVDSDKVVGVFYKNPDAIERIFTKEYILSCEQKGQYCIDKLLLNCPDITNKIMLTPDEEGKLLLHTFADEHDDKSKKYPWTPFYNINKTYERNNKLDSLAEMYLTKDSSGKYPLDYIKDKDEKIQENALKIVKKTFEDKPELLEKILENYATDIAAEEKEMEAKIKYALEHGCEFIDYEGNRIHIEIYDKSLIREILNGKRHSISNMHRDYKYKKYSPDNRLLVDRGSSEIVAYIYDDKNQLVGKEVETLSMMHSKKTSYTFKDGNWIENK